MQRQGKVRFSTAFTNVLVFVRFRSFGPVTPATVARLEELGVRVHCLALGGVDLTSSAGKMTMHVINAVAQFERDLLIERTQAGLKRAKADGKTLGRRASLNPDQRAKVVEQLAQGATVSAVARAFNTSRQTILRVRAGHSSPELV